MKKSARIITINGVIADHFAGGMSRLLYYYLAISPATVVLWQEMKQQVKEKMFRYVAGYL